jgi:DNA-binding FrmR family transcriptional regulator
MKRIAGQTDGILRMVENERYCVDILQQIAAVRAALAQVGMIVLRGHLQTCVADAVRAGGESQVFDELEQVLPKFLR